jgi:hypothetical protein
MSNVKTLKSLKAVLEVRYESRMYENRWYW